MLVTKAHEQVCEMNFTQVLPSAAHLIAKRPNKETLLQWNEPLSIPPAIFQFCLFLYSGGFDLHKTMHTDFKIATAKHLESIAPVGSILGECQVAFDGKLNGISRDSGDEQRGAVEVKNRQHVPPLFLLAYFCVGHNNHFAMSSVFS